MAKTPKTPKAASAAGAATPKTLVTFLLDRSGSMESIWDSAMASFNGLVSELKASAADIRLTLIQFDTDPHNQMDLHKVCVGQRIAKVAPLTRETYTPRGATPLLDALGTTIKAVEQSLQGREAKVVVVVQTDGQENASREYSWSGVRELVARKQAQGWEFKFLGAGLESQAYHQAGQMGLSRGSTVSYDKHNIHAAQAAFAATGANIRSFAEGTLCSTDYSAAQKAAAGDVEDQGDADGGPAVVGGLIPDYMLRRLHGGVAAPARTPLVSPRAPATPQPVMGQPAHTGVYVGTPAHPWYQGVAPNPGLGVMGTPPEGLAPRTGTPFVLDVFGEGQDRE